MNKRIKILTILFLEISPIAFSQIKEEKLVLDRKREPETKKIEKKKTSVATIKNYPPKEKKIEDSLHLKYQITDVPAVSDFKTSEIQGSDISPKFNNQYQRNYFQLGMGNYGKILADGNISTNIQKNTEVGADVHFLSTKGLTKDYNWSSMQSTAQVGAFLNSYGEKGKFNLNTNFGLDDYNYYGIYALKPASDIDLQQKVNQFNVNGYYDFYSNNILDDFRVKSSFLSDHFGANESFAELELNLAKHDIKISEVIMNADLGVNLETQKTDFAIVNKNSSHFLKSNFSPKLTFYKGKSYLMMGSDFTFSNSKNSSLILDEEKQNKIYWFPKAEILFSATDEFKFYAGINGGLKLNSYANLLKENPFLVSDLELHPTETKYHFYFGLKGDIAENVKYDFNAGLSKINQILFFKGNNLFDFNYTLQRSAYNFANTFSTIYDNGTLSEVNGSVQFFPVENLVLDGELKFQKYSLDYLKETYYKPLVTATFIAKYALLDKKLNLEFKGIFVTNRISNSYSINNNGINPNSFVSIENTNTKVDGYTDLNISTEYKIHKNFSIFALGNNLLNTKYQTFNGYKVLGLQFLAGVKITF